MAVLVCDHVCLRERPAPRAEARPQLVEEPEVDVDALVHGTVERPDVGARGTTAGVGGAGEEDGLRDRVIRQDTGPVALDAVHHADDAAVLARVRVAARATIGGQVGSRLHGARRSTSTHGLQEHVRDEDHETDASSADRDRTGRQTPGRAGTTAVLDLRRVETGIAAKAHDRRCAHLSGRVTSQTMPRDGR
jgi:hypothetical protein